MAGHDSSTQIVLMGRLLAADHLVAVVLLGQHSE